MSAIPTRLYLIRHAEVEPDYHQVFGGRIDMALSKLGHEQSQALARFFKDHTFDALFASPMKRVRQTLAPLSNERIHSPVFLDGLREVDFGIWTGLTWQEVSQRFNVNAFEWLHKLEAAAIPEAECTRAWRRRVNECLDHIFENHQGQSVGVVCHGGVIRMMLSILLDLSLIQTAHFEIEYASVTHVERHHGKKRTRIQYLNVVPWEHAQ